MENFEEMSELIKNVMSVVANTAQVQNKTEKNFSLMTNDLSMVTRGISDIKGALFKLADDIDSDRKNNGIQFKELNEKYDDICEQMKDYQENEEIKTSQVKQLHRAANKRIYDMLGTDKNDRVKYSKMFFGRLWRDAKINGCVADVISATPKRNFQNALDFIESWNPAGGTPKLKDEVDKIAEIRKQAMELGYPI